MLRSRRLCTTFDSRVNYFFKNNNIYMYDRANVFHVTPQMKPCRGIEGMGCLAHLSEAMILKPDGKAGAISDSCSQLSVF